jgi:hypothetical protein
VTQFRVVVVGAPFLTPPGLKPTERLGIPHLPRVPRVP